jgi:hypothetical protein
MTIFKCQNCGQILHFENDRCENCSHQLGFLPEQALLSAVEPDGDDLRALADPDHRYRFCANAAYSACNWLVFTESSETSCVACRHNRTIPDLTVDQNMIRWRKLENAKHRMFYSLLRLHLPLANRIDDPEQGLAFDFLGEAPATGLTKVMTGHEDGVITINIAEADDDQREKLRQAMSESYRTLVGHFRHEIGHYFWGRLVRDGGELEGFRKLFGDERQDYGQALQTHYAQGAPPAWWDHYISRYASSHPWEDFAETWAHYLHIVDTLEMASAFGVRVQPATGIAHLTTAIDFDPHEPGDINRLINAWVPLAVAVNAINRCMGEPDLYPFILTPEVIKKLGFVHDLVHQPEAVGAGGDAISEKRKN